VISPTRTPGAGVRLQETSASNEAVYQQLARTERLSTDFIPE
jgi:hypothetical protein